MKLKEYIYITEAIDDDNFYWKIDKWFVNDGEMLDNFKSIIKHCASNTVSQETLEFMLNSIKFDVIKFVDYIIDNVDNKQEISDYMYLMKKIIDTIVSNKGHEYNL